ncbi:insecticidal delta-endotoxin Cry8Ea1 family protein [Bacillus toyonensis]|uniref:insecticidal delta-endotoxin Cry8Ea1 family protein n=1 Tax=Bacillus toyonensis TaxID=155322 RepID=UPI003466B2B2
MNQYYRNNEMKVLDLEVCKPGYPLTKPSNPVNSEIEYLNRFAEINQTGVAATVLKLSWQVVQTVLRQIKAKRKNEELVARILGQVQDMLWEFRNQLWEDMMDAVEALIKKELAERVRQDAILRLEGINDALTRYKEAAENWQENKTDPVLMQEVQTQFVATETFITGSMPFFRAPGYEINLLPVYLQAADLHLLLLRDVLIFGRDWGMSAAKVEDYYSGRLGLKTLTASYTDYLVNSYNLGLQDAFNRRADLSDKTRYPWVTGNTNLYQAVEDWNVFNDYRTEMTTYALDLIAVWPVYDVYKYDKGASIQLTRLLYTDVRGSEYPGGANFTKQKIEDNIVKPPSLYGDFWQIDFYRDNNVPSTSLWRQYAGYKITSLPSAYYGAPLIYYPLRGYDYDWNNVGITPTTIPVTAPDGQPREIIYDRNKHGLACYTFQFTYNDYSQRTLGEAPANDQYESSAWPDISPEEMEQRLVWIGGVVNTQYESIPCFGFGWTYRSVTLYNTLDPSTINQIPAVKSFVLGNKAVVIKGTGATGGDLVSLPSGNDSCRMQVQISEPKSYLIRLRYASAGASTVKIAVQNYSGGDNREQAFSVPSTYDGAKLSYQSFGYLDTFAFATKPSDLFFNIEITNMGGNALTLDKVEFIPIDGSLEAYQAEQELEKAWKAVNVLFTDDKKNALRLDITDYDVDQAANQVDCISDGFFQKEKVKLLNQVKYAKRLSQARNLLNYGDFESPKWSDQNGWKVSNTITVQENDPISRGHYLHMPGARIIEFSDTLYPTYAYQKVNESKLKSYTRYLVRGFVGNSTDLELFVTRYGKEVHDKINIPISPMGIYNQTISMPSKCGADQVISYPLSSDPCQYAYPINPSGPTHRLCEDKQHFVFHIDIGEIDQRANLGIEVGFKISSSSGMAQLDNIEVIEANPLTDEALTRVKKREQKWKKEREQKCELTEKTVSAARQAVDYLFTNAQKNRLKATITMQDILRAKAKVENIPYVYNPNFEDVPGMNYAIYQALQSDIGMAFGLYDNRNVIQNGDFSSGLTYWHATSGADVQGRDGNPQVLVISNWDTNVSQDICVQPEHGYVLRVTARKEGAGKGYVTISDCTVENTETLTFTSAEMFMTDRSPVTVPTSSVCDITDSYGSGYMRNISAERNEAQSYTSTQRIPNQNVALSSTYVTKTIEMFPETNRIRIEIGETQGTFLIESIELICMEG